MPLLVAETSDGVHMNTADFIAAAPPRRAHEWELRAASRARCGSPTWPTPSACGPRSTARTCRTPVHGDPEHDLLRVAGVDEPGRARAARRARRARAGADRSGHRPARPHRAARARLGAARAHRPLSAPGYSRGSDGARRLLRRHGRLGAHRAARAARHARARAAATACSSTAARARSASSCAPSGSPELDAVFITHLHADHWLGLPGMLKTFDLRDRERPLRVHGPPGLARCWAACGRSSGGRLPARRRRARAATRGGVATATRSRVRGRAPRAGARLRARRGRPARALRRRAPRARSASRQGPDFGRLQRGETVGGVRPEQVMGERRRGRKVVLSGDTRPARRGRASPPHGADLLVHEATFLEDERDRARRDGPLAPPARPPSWRATPACGCSRSPTSRRATSRARSATRRARSSPTPSSPRDFDAVEMPFPERGEPQRRAPRTRELEPASRRAGRAGRPRAAERPAAATAGSPRRCGSTPLMATIAVTSCPLPRPSNCAAAARIRPAPGGGAGASSSRRSASGRALAIGVQSGAVAPTRPATRCAARPRRPRAPRARGGPRSRRSR